MTSVRAIEAIEVFAFATPEQLSFVPAPGPGECQDCMPGEDPIIVDLRPAGFRLLCPEHWRIEHDLGLQWAWQQWRIASCLEFNGAHTWHLAGEGAYPPEYWIRNVWITCATCPATVDEIMPDGNDAVSGLAGGLEIRDGQHYSLLDFSIPVTVKVIDSSSYFPEYGWESDWYVEIGDPKPYRGAPALAATDGLRRYP